MDALRRILIDVTYQVLVDLLRHERDHRRCHLADGHQCGIQGHIGIDLILFHAFGPETLTASSDVPVAHVIHKLLKRSCRLRNLIIPQITVHGLD